jgi:hypothetical protein
MANENLMKNKRGEIVLRDIMFMVIIFAGIMALASVFVVDMAITYDNSEVISEYSGTNKVGGIGNNLLFGNVTDSVSSMRSQVESGEESEESLLGSFTSITGVIKGAATILLAVVKAPVYIGNAMTIMMDALNIPNQISQVIGNVFIFIIYIIIIFVIVSVLTRGGRKI